MKTIPCKTCLVMAACRHKKYRDMISGCVRIGTFLLFSTGSGERHKKRVIKLEKFMKPTTWMLGTERPSGYDVVDI